MLARFDRRAVLVALAAVLASRTAAQAVELDPRAVQIKTPAEFKWRNPSMQAPNNAVLLGDPAQAGSLFVHINSFVPGHFGEAHFHPNDRYVLVVDGAPWRGTGNIVDPEHATRVPRGTFMIEQAGKVHWDGTKDESGAYFIIEIPPSGQTPAPKEAGPWHGGDPSAAKIIMPNEIPWRSAPATEQAVLAGDPSKPGVYVTMSKWRNGPFTHPHFHSADRYAYVLDGTWWVGTGAKFDPEHLAVPVKAGSLVTELAKGVLWAGARDEGATVLMFGVGPVSNTAVEETK
jgi:quercetin dioxygenase-like cupin family protein